MILNWKMTRLLVTTSLCQIVIYEQKELLLYNKGVIIFR